MDVQESASFSEQPITIHPQRAGAQAASLTSWKVGDVILDQYEVVGHLGEGGMGTVQKLHHRGWNIDLAVKSPRPAVFSSESGKENFLREAETWVNLGLHPHIVQCQYVRVIDGIPRIFAECIEGGSLSTWICRRTLYQGGKQQALARILDVAIQCAWGLHSAHEQGLIHQDVKPANVLMTEDGQAKITDFGLAKARALAGEIPAPESEQSILVSSRGMTPAYCSPEQAAKKQLSRRSDLWSWGVSVLEMFVGKVTWLSGVVAREALASHAPLHTSIPVMPPEIVKVLNQCFQPHPDQRPATLLEIAGILQTVYERVVGQSYPRAEPRASDLLADSLNNRALSLYDLGKAEEAQRCWEQALQADPQHLESTYNHGLVLWRQAALTDDELVNQMEAVQNTHPEQWQATYLLTLVHLERDDEKAVECLKKAAEMAPEEREIQLVLERIQSGAIQLGHHLQWFRENTGNVTSAYLSADGRIALTGSEDRAAYLLGTASGEGKKTARIWDAASGTCLHVLEGHSDGVTSVSLSADGRIALSGSYDKTARIWDAASGICLHVLEGHSDRVTSVSLSADGSLALSGSRDMTVRLWEVVSGRCLRVFERHGGPAYSVSLSANGHYALSGSYDKTVRLWEVASGKCLRVFEGHKDIVTSVSLSADGSLALSGSWDMTVRLWEVVSGRCLRVFKGHSSVVTLVNLSPDGSLALSNSEDMRVRLWEVASGRCLRTFIRSKDYINSIGLHSAGLLILFRCLGEFVGLWEMAREHFLAPFQLSQVHFHKDIFSNQSKVTALLQQAENALSQGQYATVLTLTDQIRLLPGWKRQPALMALRINLLPFYSKERFSAGWLARSFSASEQSLTAACLSADGKLSLVGSADGTILLWEVTLGECLRIFAGHKDKVTSVSLSADSRYALSGSHDKTVRLWKVASGRCLRIFERHTSAVTSVSLSADGRYAISGGEDDNMCLWEISSRDYLHVNYLSSAVSSVRLSADGCYALSGTRTNKVMQLWEMPSGRCLRTFEGHEDWVASVDLSADGHWALSASQSGMLRLWELDWELEAHEPGDWDEGARPILETFLRSHFLSAAIPAPDHEQAGKAAGEPLLRKREKPVWNEEDFQELLRQLHAAGYGWLHSEEVRRKLEKMSLSWKGLLMLPHLGTILWKLRERLRSLGKR